MYAVYDGIAPQPTKIDLVVENYFPLSIKNIEREREKKRMKILGKRYEITSGTQKAPAEWKSFMSNRNNKQDLPEFLVNE